MATMTVSKKFQVVIPKEVREKLHLKIGQKICIVEKAGIIFLIPQRPLASYKGFLKNKSGLAVRDCEDR